VVGPRWDPFGTWTDTWHPRATWRLVFPTRVPCARPWPSAAQPLGSLWLPALRRPVPHDGVRGARAPGGLWRGRLGCWGGGLVPCPRAVLARPDDPIIVRHAVSCPRVRVRPCGRVSPTPLGCHGTLWALQPGGLLAGARAGVPVAVRRWARGWVAGDGGCGKLAWAAASGKPSDTPLPRARPATAAHVRPPRRLRWPSQPMDHARQYWWRRWRQQWWGRRLRGTPILVRRKWS
jgi:hypothetical protein